MHSTRVLSRIKRLLSQVGSSTITLDKAIVSKQLSSFKHSDDKLKLVKVMAGVGMTACAGYSLYHVLESMEDGVKALSKLRAGEPISTLPWYSLSDIQNHKDLKSSIWVVFRQGVYDITEFVQMHPGGEIIMKAAGGSIEPFWAMYGVHLQDEVFELLESYRIGNISQEDSKLAAKDIASDPYVMEPVRSPLLKATSLKPYNAEPPPSMLVENFLTPSDIFYVRNHLPVPVVDENSYRLHIEAPRTQSVSLSLEDIKKLPPVTITAAVMCAGNRRSEMSQVKPVKGLTWGHAAVGNATWTGARLVDVLKAAGISPDQSLDSADVQHFEGLDMDLARTPYAASIPATKALDPRGDVILAYEMNGEPLSRDHGAPLRAVVPGVVGARNVKWLGKVILSDHESTSHWQQNDYKGFSPSTDWDTVDFAKSPAIQELPVISAICLPVADAKLKLENQQMEVQGYAWSGGGKAIVRVDVTIDQGRTWHVANFTGQDSQAPLTRHWGWTLWRATIPVDPKTKEVEIWSKAVDSSYNTQPESFANIWNLRGSNFGSKNFSQNLARIRERQMIRDANS
ncbi:hypothetical protein M8J76_012407 [Diaphorina citri]|nr:hypothetical protein M8J76_012407 [Diaphorina citri]